MRHFHDLYAMKHCHMANGHPRRKMPKFPDGGASVPRRGSLPMPPPPVAPRLLINRAKFQLDRFGVSELQVAENRYLPGIDSRYHPYNSVCTNVLHCDFTTSVGLLNTCWKSYLPPALKPLTESVTR